MITAFRWLAGTWFSKALFVLLILSFVIWGIEDVIRNMWRDDAVVRLEGGTIELPEAQVAARRQLSALQRQLGSRFEVTPAVRDAVSAQAVEGLVVNHAFTGEANRLGVVTPPEAVRDYIWAIPAFRGADGRFSRMQFDSFLQSNNLTEGELMNLASISMQRQQVATALLAGAVPPEALVAPLLQWQDEKRNADLVELPFLSAAEPAAPTDEQLKRYWENNADRFSAPEYRDATVAVLSAETVLPEVEITDAAIEESYNARRDQLGTPEKREVQQVLIADEAKAKLVAEAWKPGMAFTDIEAKAKEEGGQAVDLGLIERSGLPFPELAAAAFGLADGATSAPVRSPFGWHVLHVTKIEAGHTPPLAEVKDQIKRDLGMEKAGDLAFERANKVEDALAGGATLAEVSKQFGLRSSTVKVDATGLGVDGRPVTLPVPAPQRADTLRRIFATAAGSAPHLDEIEGGAMLSVEVANITPSAVKPFETVQNDVRRLWTNDQRRREQEVKAAALLAAVKGGKSLPDAAKEAGLEVVRRDGIARTLPANVPPGGAAPQQLLAPLFSLAKGETTMVETGDAFVVAQLDAIVPHDVAGDALGRGQVKDEVTRTMQADLEQELTATLRERAKPRINQALMRQVLGGE